MTNRRTLILPALTALMFVLVACNTVKGAGQDVEKAGEVIQKTAEKHD